VARHNLTESGLVRVPVAALAFSLLLLTTIPAAQAPPSVIVVNTANPAQSVTVAELRRMFMKQSRLWPHGESVVPVDWDATSPVRQEFSRRVLGRSVREMAEFWVQQSITQGIAPPSTLRSGLAISRFVASVPGAISYLPPDAMSDSVKPIKVQGVQ
jgi:hypothetical protein